MFRLFKHFNEVEKTQQGLEKAVEWTKARIAALDKPIAMEIAFDKSASMQEELSQNVTDLKEAKSDNTELAEPSKKEIANETDTGFDDKKKETPFYDDNGNEYRIGNELLPNNSYELNGYKFTTDENGRIISAEGTLHMTEREKRLRIKDSIEDIGKGDQREGDDRGHLIGDQFDGPNGMENLIPQDAAINQKDYRTFENQLANAVKEGKTVYVKVEPYYEGASRRPSDIVVTYNIDGNENIRVFPNNKEAV
ncbi:MAG: DNA/RNA non-specific endonuclease [Synergistaceae bacterium]|nr:DNA/RNA non-specific endonuclease [Synergistaceae bacterium]MBR2208852.1 DNA/RNA non-specific endonuclease [Synergistaceae bacterium]